MDKSAQIFVETRANSLYLSFLKWNSKTYRYMWYDIYNKVMLYKSTPIFIACNKIKSSATKFDEVVLNLRIHY